MKKNMLIQASLLFMIAIGVLACQSGEKETTPTGNTSNDTTANRNIKPTDSGYVDVNGLRMYYEVYGAGKPLVLLHGSFMNIPMTWSEVIPLLTDRKVIVMELQGHGRTKDIPREFSYENMADDVSGLLKHLKVDSADVLGYSMGAGVAFQFGVRHPEQLRRLVIVSGTYTHDGWLPEVEAMWPTFNGEAFKGSPIQKQYDSLGNDPAKFDAFIKKVISVDIKKYDWSKDVKNIKAPIFMAIGDVDGMRYEHAIELFRARGGGKMGDLSPSLPHSRLAILPGTTHIGMMMQRKNWLIPMVTDFLDADLNAPPPTF
jgi:pimeloyl-ACP methyl ester carboxylesterase